MEQIADEIRSLISRISVLEAATTSNQEDFSDPPLYLVKVDESPVSPDSIEDIPDLVKGLPQFTGDPNELSTFIQDAETLVRLYTPRARSTLDEKNKFHVICKSIRRKIKGEANDALVASNVNLNWSMIKKTLITYYGEKRDIETLDYQLMSSQQKGDTLENYYDKVNRTLSLIANSIRTDERFAHPEATKAMLYTYNKKAIDAFIRGLDGDLGRFLKNYGPESLAHAYSYCVSFQNLEYRKNITNHKTFEIQTKPRNSIPILPPKPVHLSRIPVRPMQYPRMNLYPPRQMPFMPQPQRNYQYFPQAPPRQPFRPELPQIPQRNPFKAPEPMEVDPSIRTANINYSNRPQNSYQQKPPLKRPRLFHAATESYQDPDTEDQAHGNTDYVSFDDEEYYPEHMQTLERYLHTVENQQAQINESPESDEGAELNFLG